MAIVINRLFINKGLKDFNSGTYPNLGTKEQIDSVLLPSISKHISGLSQDQAQSLRSHLHSSWDGSNVDTNAEQIHTMLSKEESVKRAVEQLLSEENLWVSKATSLIKHDPRLKDASIRTQVLADDDVIIYVNTKDGFSSQIVVNVSDDYIGVQGYMGDGYEGSADDGSLTSAVRDISRSYFDWKTSG